VHRNKFLFNKLIFPNIFLSRNSTCVGQFLCPSSGVFHCTFGTGLCHQNCMTQTSAECTVENSWWWARRNCLKHVEFLDKNTFGKINASVCFIKKIIWDVLKAVPNSLHPTSTIYFRISTSIPHLFSLPQAVVLPSLSHIFHVPILLALVQNWNTVHAHVALVLKF